MGERPRGRSHLRLPLGGKTTAALAVSLYLLTAGTGCDLPLTGLDLGSASVAPSLACPSDTVTIDWRYPDDGSCEACTAGIRVSPGTPAPPQNRTASTTRTVTADTTFNVRGNVCQESNCRSSVLPVSVDVVEVPGEQTIRLEGVCGPRWTPVDLRERWSPCLKVSQMCNPGDYDVEITVTDPSGTPRSATIPSRQCTRELDGRPGQVAGGISIDDMDFNVRITNFRCGETYDESNPTPDIVLTVQVVCSEPGEC